MTTTKRCPWCAEEILAEAKKCKHCGEFLERAAPGEGHLPAEQIPSRPTATVASLACDTCGVRLTSKRELYLHRVNEHNQMETIATGGTPGSRSRPSSTFSPIICPHCHRQGRVQTKKVKLKRGISGGKATGAVLTAGLSILATGLSRKEEVTEAHCHSCGVTWHI